MGQFAQKPDSQNYSNIVASDAQGSYQKLYEEYRDKYREAEQSLKELNYIQTVTGTLADILQQDGLDLEKMQTALPLGNGDAHAVIQFDVSALGMETYTQTFYSYGNSYFFTCAAEVNLDGSLANLVQWSSLGEFSQAYMEQDGVITDLSTYASLVPATLTIYWHPMQKK